MHGKEPGSVMIVEFEIEGQTFTALNGGPQFKFNEAVSFQVMCDTQAGDRLLLEQARPPAGRKSQCGWLKDKYGLSWQVVPSLAATDDRCRRRQVGARDERASLKMKKFDLAALKQAYAGHA